MSQLKRTQEELRKCQEAMNLAGTIIKDVFHTIMPAKELSEIIDNEDLSSPEVQEKLRTANRAFVFRSKSLRARYSGVFGG